MSIQNIPLLFKEGVGGGCKFATIRMQIQCTNASNCHSRERGNPGFSYTWIIQIILITWIPAFAGMTVKANAQSLTSLRHEIDSLFHDPKFSNATFGVAVQSLATGETLYRLNDTKS